MGDPVRVVLADDVEEIRALLRLTLELDGRFEVVGEAADGAQAVAVVSSRCPDVVILDISMPVMDGIQAIPEIVQRCPDATIIVLSALEGDTSAAALAAGADAYIVKGEESHEDVVPKILALRG